MLQQLLEQLLVILVLLCVLSKYISDGTRRRDPRRTEKPPSLDASSSSSTHPQDTPSPDASSSSSTNPQDTPTLDASSSSSSRPQDNYEVFLSFRGETGKTFTSFLYKALDEKGIYTFLDVKRLERGEDISPGLDKAIEGSRCAVVVLSGNYASSRWCMDELVKILQCRNDSKIKQIVLPIFYHVNPDDILKQKGRIWEAFQSLKREFPNNEEKVKTWSDALIQVANIAGHHVHHGTIESQFIEDFIEVVSSKLFDRALLNISEDLVGMESRLEKLKRCVSSSGDIRFIGICGLGGLGKTTLAEVYLKYMSGQFQATSFLANIRETCKREHDGLVKLQKQLLRDVLKGEHTINNVSEGKGMIRRRLCGKKILVVLDDVDQLDQLEGLAEKKIWFGDGSQIIVTTRVESLLPCQYEEEEYIIQKVDELENNEALRLFSSKAFKRDCPPEDYTKLSAKVIKYASGLPLALVVLGSFLRGKTRDEWKSALDRLKEYPENEIMRVLRISFDGLRETEKNIFLDIACFFNGSHKDYVMNIMDRCGFFPVIGIRSLVDKSLLRMDDDSQLRMHDLLEEMGKDIVREKSRDDPIRRSRIWLRDDLIHALNNDKGTEEVEAIVCRHMELENNFTLRGFSNMKKLRLLIVGGMDFKIDRRPDNEYLPNELRLLEWYGFPFKSFPRSFQPHRLVELILNYGEIEQLWDNPMMKPLYNLKSIDLSSSKQIRKLENLNLFPNLETLILVWCDHLEEIDPSIKDLKKLTLLSLNYCERLKSLPTSMSGLESLEVLHLSNCSSLKNLPEGTGVNGDKLQAYGWENIWNTIGGNGLSSAGLSCLKKLDLSGCHLVHGELPYDFGCLVSLEYLNLSENFFFHLPACFNRLSKLRDLHLSYCYCLRSLGRQLPDSLECVMVNDCEQLHSILDPLRRCLRCSTIFCINCFALVEREGSERMSITSLGRYIQNPLKPSKRFDIVLPGNEIPSWFTHRVKGSSSISLPLHPNWCANKWMGFALSVCFIGTDKWHNKFGHIQFAFKSYQQDEKFIRCGVRLVYEKDIEELNCQAIELQDEDADWPSSKARKVIEEMTKMISKVNSYLAEDRPRCLDILALSHNHWPREVDDGGAHCSKPDPVSANEMFLEIHSDTGPSESSVIRARRLSIQGCMLAVVGAKRTVSDYTVCVGEKRNGLLRLFNLSHLLIQNICIYIYKWGEGNGNKICETFKGFQEGRLGAAGGGGVMEFMWRAVAVKMFIYTI
ncbi:hypothetical protein FNV43_RR01924 [Rhamnella rubrinervis]|uniref:ADP-ribosyl cyclase/cyclic ADP-ribose hydrolase n=1 Tax=Rhamnella rubrinervis TaxID=2594499 RepID=A0A8K0MSR7_9ROSA|nr:hypothetical protein FNV43_RR01924 [Rhamnella rubrinervis]